MKDAVLIKETHIYEVDTETLADKLIEEAIAETEGDVSFARKFKQKTKSGEIVATWYEVKIEQSYPFNKKSNNL